MKKLTILIGTLLAFSQQAFAAEEDVVTLINQSKSPMTIAYKICPTTANHSDREVVCDGVQLQTAELSARDTSGSVITIPFNHVADNSDPGFITYNHLVLINAKTDEAYTNWETKNNLPDPINKPNEVGDFGVSTVIPFGGVVFNDFGTNNIFFTSGYSSAKPEVADDKMTATMDNSATEKADEKTEAPSEEPKPNNQQS